VSVHPKGDQTAGNSTGAVLASLATDVEDPVERLRAVVASTRVAKAQLEGMPQEAALAYSAVLLAPHLIPAAAAMTGLPDPLPFTFNVCISNIAGPATPLYFHGARLEATYPVSIPTHGMALNITLHSNAGKLNFGFVGDRDALPSLQRLAVYTGRALDELEGAVGLEVGADG
jgi:diacylglycerol O-acyltransferase